MDEVRTVGPGDVSLAHAPPTSGDVSREELHDRDGVPGPPDSGEVLSDRSGVGRDTRDQVRVSDVAGVTSAGPAAVRAVDFDDRAANAEVEVPAQEPLAAPVEVSLVPGLAAADTAKKKKKKKGAKEQFLSDGGAPASARGASARDELSLSQKFYTTTPPPQPDHDADHEADHEAAQPVAVTPEVLERKAKLRRIVGGICAAAALVVVMVAGKTLFEKKASPTAAPTAAMVEAEAPKEEPAKPEEAKPAPTPVAPVDPAKAADDAKKAEEAEKAKAEKAKAEEAEKAKAEEAEKAKADPAELKKTASKLYNSGKLKDAIPALRAAIAADPADALYYLFLGDSLTNTGKWPEAKEAYNECMRNATKGPKHECAAMGGRK